MKMEVIWKENYTNKRHNTNKNEISKMEAGIKQILPPSELNVINFKSIPQSYQSNCNDGNTLEICLPKYKNKTREK